MKILKFGGGCLRSPQYVMKVVDIVRNQKQPLALVVSAIHGITDLLAGGIVDAFRGEHLIPDCMEAINRRHLSLIEALVRDQSLADRLRKSVREKISQISRLLRGVSYIREITDTVKSQVLSYGERLASDLMAVIFQDNGIPAVAMSADDIGLVTDDAIHLATALLEETRINFERSLIPRIEEGKIPVVTGFFGQTREGRVSSFGRNGSDYSAAVVAFGLQADTLELWKDVDGFMSTDPSIIPESRRIDRLSYKEAAELSYFGSKLMHPRTIEPLMDMGIDIYIRNLHRPDEPGTVISAAGYPAEGVIKGLTCNRQIALLKIYGPGVGNQPGLISRIGRTLADIRVNIYSVITSQTSINLLVDKSDAADGFRVLSRMRVPVIEDVGIDDDVALVALVGEGLMKTMGVAAMVFSAVAAARVNVEMISAGASEVSLYLIVKNEQADPVIRALHRQFFGPGIYRVSSGESNAGVRYPGRFRA